MLSRYIRTGTLYFDLFGTMTTDQDIAVLSCQGRADALRELAGDTNISRPGPDIFYNRVEINALGAAASRGLSLPGGTGNALVYPHLATWYRTLPILLLW